MSKQVDWTGETVGRWKVLHKCDRPEGKTYGTWWMCECQCEKKTKQPVAAGNLAAFKKNGTGSGSSSCGCVIAEKASERRYKHGQSGENRTPIYGVWRNIVKRCTDPNCSSYPLYGGREEYPRTLCERWKVFANFYADMGDQPDGMEVDRIDNERDGYWCGKPECPECGPLNRTPTCRWATPADNARNRAIVKKFLYNGELLTAGQISDLLGGTPSPQVLKDRLLRQGLTMEEAISLPVPEAKTYDYKGERLTLAALSKISGLSISLLNQRINVWGWSVQKAVEQPRRGQTAE